MRRHLLQPGTIRRDPPPPAPARREGCVHGFNHACPWPACERGVAGTRLVVCGVSGPKYFERALDVEVIHPAIPNHGRLVIRWAEVAVEDVPDHDDALDAAAVGMAWREAACGT
jgi:hypothetical protein